MRYLLTLPLILALAACTPTPIAVISPSPSPVVNTSTSPSPTPSPSPNTLQVAQSVTVSTLTGTGEFGYYDGLLNEALFYHPTGISLDPNGNVYIVDRMNEAIRRINLNGRVSTMAGGENGYTDARSTQSRFNQPINVWSPNPDGIFVADANNNVIRVIRRNLTVETFAGDGSAGHLDGPLKAAQFNWPSGIVSDSAGNLYISERYNHAIRKIDTAGNVTTLAGRNFGYADGQGEEARFNEPMGLTIDADNNLYVADANNHRIRKITPQGEVTTVAGSTQGAADGRGTAAQFNTPAGLVIDTQGHIYVVDRFNHLLRKISPDGQVTTLAGAPGEAALVNGPGSEARLSYPFGIALRDDGSLLIADYGNHAIRLVTLSE
jgi:streptogramin lyase